MWGVGLCSFPPPGPDAAPEDRTPSAGVTSPSAGPGSAPTPDSLSGRFKQSRPTAETLGDVLVENKADRNRDRETSPLGAGLECAHVFYSGSNGGFPLRARPI